MFEGPNFYVSILASMESLYSVGDRDVLVFCHRIVKVKYSPYLLSERFVLDTLLKDISLLTEQPNIGSSERIVESYYQETSRHSFRKKISPPVETLVRTYSFISCHVLFFPGDETSVWWCCRTVYWTGTCRRRGPFRR